MNPLDDFKNWQLQIKLDLEEVEDLLSTTLSDEPENLIHDLEIIEAWNSRVGYLLAQANSHLERCRFFLLPSKEDATELERKVELDHLASEVRQQRDRIESDAESIKQRLILGESIIGFMKQFKING